MQKISGNKVKQEVEVRVGVEQELAKKIVKLLKDSKMKVQAAIQGDAVRVSGAKRDVLPEAIALVQSRSPISRCSTATSATRCPGQGRNPTGAQRPRASIRVRVAMAGQGDRDSRRFSRSGGARVPHRGRYAFHRHPARSRGTSGEGIMEASAIAAMAYEQCARTGAAGGLGGGPAQGARYPARVQCSLGDSAPSAPAVGSTAGGIVDTWA